MSCDRDCGDETSKWFGHEDCSICPGQDSGPSKNGQKHCADCREWHDVQDWPHEPEAKYGTGDQPKATMPVFPAVPVAYGRTQIDIAKPDPRDAVVSAAVRVYKSTEAQLPAAMDELTRAVNDYLCGNAEGGKG